MLAALACGGAGLLGSASAAHAVSEAYALSINTPSSLLTYTFSTAAPFTGAMTGDPLATPPTRLKRATAASATIPLCLFPSGCGTVPTTANDAINISGTVGASGATNANSPIRPGGTFVIGIDTINNAATARNLNVNLLSSGSISATANLNGLTYQPFCAGTGTSTSTFCTLPFCGAIDVPLGTAVVTSINASQTAAASGTLTPVAGDPNSFDYSIPITVTVTTTGTLSVNPLAFDPQTVPGTLAGRITRAAGNTASSNVTLAFNVSSAPSSTPTVLPPAPFVIPAGTPACAELAVQVGLTLTSTSVTTTNSAAIVAAGPRLKCACDADNSGTLNIDDIFIFINIWFANGPGADFDQNGTRNIDDIFQFINCFFQPPFPC
jgi:hypothetical protein